MREPLSTMLIHHALDWPKAYLLEKLHDDTVLCRCKQITKATLFGEKLHTVGQHHDPDTDVECPRRHQTSECQACFVKHSYEMCDRSG
jgi:hypothetical protein